MKKKNLFIVLSVLVFSIVGFQAYSVMIEFYSDNIKFSDFNKEEIYNIPKYNADNKSELEDNSMHSLGWSKLKRKDGFLIIETLLNEEMYPYMMNKKIPQDNRKDSFSSDNIILQLTKNNKEMAYKKDSVFLQLDKYKSEGENLIKDTEKQISESCSINSKDLKEYHEVKTMHLKNPPIIPLKTILKKLLNKYKSDASSNSKSCSNYMKLLEEEGLWDKKNSSKIYKCLKNLEKNRKQSIKNLKKFNFSYKGNINNIYVYMDKDIPLLCVIRKGKTSYHIKILKFNSVLWNDIDNTYEEIALSKFNENDIEIY